MGLPKTIDKESIMSISEDIERVVAAGKRQEARRARRCKKVNEFWDEMKSVFSEKMPLFIPSIVDTEKHTRKPMMSWGKADLTLMDDWKWKKNMEDALIEDKKDGCIQVKMGLVSYNLCALDVDADELVEVVLEAMPFLKKTFSTLGSKGRTYWFYMKGEYPLHKKQIHCHGYTSKVDEKGNPLVLKIEFLTAGCLCTIWGTHYKVVEPYRQYGSKVITIEFADIEKGVAKIEDATWASKPSSNGSSTRPRIRIRHSISTLSNRGNIDLKAYDAAREEDSTIAALLVEEYFPDAQWSEEKNGWRCGDRTGRASYHGGKGSFAIEPNGRTTDWDYEPSDPEAHPTLLDCICSDERDEKNTYDSVFSFLAEQAEEYNFFKAPSIFFPSGRKSSWANIVKGKH